MAYVDLDNCRRTLSRNEILCTLPRSHCLDIVFPAQSFPEVESVYIFGARLSFTMDVAAPELVQTQSTRLIYMQRFRSFPHRAFPIPRWRSPCPLIVVVDPSKTDRVTSVSFLLPPLPAPSPPSATSSSHRGGASSGALIPIPPPPPHAEREGGRGAR